MEVTSHSRRGFLKFAGAGAAALVSPSQFTSAAPRSNPVGCAAISWPREHFEHALGTMAGLGFAGVQMLGWTRAQYASRVEYLRGRLQTLKLTPVALSCGSVAFHSENPRKDAGLIRTYADFFSRLGGRYLQITDGGKPDDEYSNEAIRQLGLRINELGRIAADNGLVLGYHPHVGTLGETREGMARVLDATDERYVKLIADVGHIALGGADPAEIVRTYSLRLLFLHFKDVRKDAAEAARANRTTLRDRKYSFCEIGTGVVDFPAVVDALRKVEFKGWIIVELDGNEPAPGGPDASARANRETLRKLGF